MTRLETATIHFLSIFRWKFFTHARSSHGRQTEPSVGDGARRQRWRTLEPAGTMAQPVSEELDCILQ
jgi:hypothetical protein